MQDFTIKYMTSIAVSTYDVKVLFLSDKQKGSNFFAQSENIMVRESVVVMLS